MNHNDLASFLQAQGHWSDKDNASLRLCTIDSDREAFLRRKVAAFIFAKLAEYAKACGYSGLDITTLPQSMEGWAARSERALFFTGTKDYVFWSRTGRYVAWCATHDAPLSALVALRSALHPLARLEGLEVNPAF